LISTHAPLLSAAYPVAHEQTRESSAVTLKYGRLVQIVFAGQAGSASHGTIDVHRPVMGNVSYPYGQPQVYPIVGAARSMQVCVAGHETFTLRQLSMSMHVVCPDPSTPISNPISHEHVRPSAFADAGGERSVQFEVPGHGDVTHASTARHIWSTPAAYPRSQTHVRPVGPAGGGKSWHTTFVPWQLWLLWVPHASMLTQTPPVIWYPAVQVHAVPLTSPSPVYCGCGHLHTRPNGEADPPTTSVQTALVSHGNA
jgi:hypothetical protein